MTWCNVSRPNDSHHQTMQKWVSVSSHFLSLCTLNFGYSYQRLISRKGLSFEIWATLHFYKIVCSSVIFAAVLKKLFTSNTFAFVLVSYCPYSVGSVTPWEPLCSASLGTPQIHWHDLSSNVWWGPRSCMFWFSSSRDLFATNVA